MGSETWFRQLVLILHWLEHGTLLFNRRAWSIWWDFYGKNNQRTMYQGIWQWSGNALGQRIQARQDWDLLLCPNSLSIHFCLLVVLLTISCWLFLKFGIKLVTFLFTAMEKRDKLHCFYFLFFAFRGIFGFLSLTCHNFQFLSWRRALQ